MLAYRHCEFVYHTLHTGLPSFVALPLPLIMAMMTDRSIDGGNFPGGRRDATGLIHIQIGSRSIDPILRVMCAV